MPRVNGLSCTAAAPVSALVFAFCAAVWVSGRINDAALPAAAFKKRRRCVESCDVAMVSPPFDPCVKPQVCLLPCAISSQADNGPVERDQQRQHDGLKNGLALGRSGTYPTR